MAKQPKKLCGIAVHFDGWEAVSVSDLKPHPRNNRKHGDKQVALLSKSIRGQGWRWGIIVSKNSGFIVAGHARREAALLMQLDKVPVIYQSFESEEHEKAYRLADNRIAELAEIQQDAINELLEELTDTGFDIELSGHDLVEGLKKEVEGLGPGKTEELKPYDRINILVRSSAQNAIALLADIAAAAAKHEGTEVYHGGN